MYFTQPQVKLYISSRMFIRYNHSFPFYDHNFLKWFVGFSPHPSALTWVSSTAPRDLSRGAVRCWRNFLISLYSGLFIFILKISLHLDYIQVLKLIQSKLGVGSVTEWNINYCSFVVQDFLRVFNIICPIFINFPLQSPLFGRFKRLYQAILIKRDKGNKFSEQDFLKISPTLWANGLNLGRINNVCSTKADAANSFSCSPHIVRTINPYWLIGFIEGDGTFGIKNGSPY